jgi:hypothetical protein
LRGFSENMQIRGKRSKCVLGLEVPYIPTEFRRLPPLRKNFMRGGVKTSHPHSSETGMKSGIFLNADLKYSMSATFEQNIKKNSFRQFR